jgi:hypothetical protein
MDDMSRSSADIFNHDYYVKSLTDNYPFALEEPSRDVRDYY